MRVKKIGVVSLSSGIMGENFIQHELNIGLERLKQYGIEVEFLPNALKGMEFIKNHPECDTPEKDRLKCTDANNFILKNALKFIYEHYKLKLSLLDVAEQCFISSWHLSKLLNQYTGRGFFEIVNTIRIDKAKDLLENKNYKIQDVSERVGFQDVTHFCRIFKSYVGKSPSDYRNYGGKGK